MSPLIRRPAPGPARCKPWPRRRPKTNGPTAALTLAAGFALSLFAPSAAGGGIAAQGVAAQDVVAQGVTAQGVAAQGAVEQGPPTRLGAEASTVTIREVEFLAPLLTDPRVEAVLGAGEARAEADVLRARSFASPELEVEREAPGDGEETTLTVGWRPPWPGRRELRLGAAEARLDAARLRNAAEVAEWILEWRAAFASWAAAEARVAELSRHQDSLLGFERRTRQRAEAGEVAGLDARRLSLAAAAVATELAAARAELLAARATARGWRPDLPAGAIPELPPWPDGGTEETGGDPPPGAVGDARLAAAEAEARSAELALELASRAFDAPRVSAGWKRADEGGGGEVAEGPVVGLSWSVPLARSRRAARAEAAAESSAAAARADLLRRELEAELAGARAAAHSLTAAAITAADAAAEADPATAAARAAFTAGELELTALLDVLAAAHRARLDALDLRFEALAAHRRHQRLSGAPVRVPTLDSAP